MKKIKLVFGILFYFIFFSSCKETNPLIEPKNDLWISTCHPFRLDETGKLVQFKNNKIYFADTYYFTKFYGFSYSLDEKYKLLHIKDPYAYKNNVVPDTSLIEIVEKSEDKMIWNLNYNNINKSLDNSNSFLDTMKFVRLKPNIHSIDVKKLLHNLFNSMWVINGNDKDDVFYCYIFFTNAVSSPIINYDNPDAFVCFSRCPNIEQQDWESISWKIRKIEDNVFLTFEIFGIYERVFHIVSITKDNIKAYHYLNDSIFDLEFIKQSSYENYMNTHR